MEFYVADPAATPESMPKWSFGATMPGLHQWLARARHSQPARFPRRPRIGRELILATARPPVRRVAPRSFAELARRIARGATVVFLCPAVFAQGNDKTAWLPLARKGNFAGLPSWLYHKDEWAKRHPIFDGLPAGGLMDYTFYRELIPNTAFTGTRSAGRGGSSGHRCLLRLFLGVAGGRVSAGAGEFVLNSLQIREQPGPSSGRRQAAAEHAPLCRREDASAACPTSRGL